VTYGGTNSLGQAPGAYGQIIDENQIDAIGSKSQCRK